MKLDQGSVRSKSRSRKKFTDSSRAERTEASEEDEEASGAVEEDRARAIIKDTTTTTARTTEATATDTARAIMAILAMTIQDTTIQTMAMDKAMMITVVNRAVTARRLGKAAPIRTATSRIDKAAKHTHVHAGTSLQAVCHLTTTFSGRRT